MGLVSTSIRLLRTSLTLVLYSWISRGRSHTQGQRLFGLEEQVVLCTQEQLDRRGREEAPLDRQISRSQACVGEYHGGVGNGKDEC